MSTTSNVRRLFVIGGLLASVVLLAFGTASIAMGVNGRTEVRDSIAREQIVGTDDSTIPGEKVDTGEEAKAFAAVMRKHTLAATEGRTYAEMGRFVTEDGGETNDPAKAAKDPTTGEPMPNHERDIWVTSLALSTALNTSYFAEQVSLFSILMGVALLLTGIGFTVLTIGALRLPQPGITVMPVRDRTDARLPAGV